MNVELTELGFYNPNECFSVDLQYKARQRGPKFISTIVQRVS